MLSADSTTPLAAAQALYDSEDDEDGPAVSLTDVLIWLGERKALIGAVTGGVAVLSLVVSLLLTPIFTARTTFLAPGSQQQSGSAAALAALGSIGSLSGLGAKTPDDLYVALLKSDSVQRGLDQRFNLRAHYDVKTYETLRKVLPNYVRVSADKKSGVISVEVDDKDAKFAADLANAHEPEVTKLLGRLAVSEAQLRRVFFEKQLQDTKENLVKAEQSLQAVQEKSGVIVLDKQAEALINNAALLRAQISEREVQLQGLAHLGHRSEPGRDAPQLRAARNACRAGADGIEPGRRARQRRRPAGRADPGGVRRLRARAPRAQAAGDDARGHAAPVRDRQARRGQGRARCCSRSTSPRSPTTSRSRRAPSSSWPARCSPCSSSRGGSSCGATSRRCVPTIRPQRRPGTACVHAWSFRR